MTIHKASDAVIRWYDTNMHKFDGSITVCGLNTEIDKEQLKADDIQWEDDFYERMNGTRPEVTCDVCIFLHMDNLCCT